MRCISSKHLTGKTADKTATGLTYIPAPKLKLPGHEESYNPPAEYLPTEVGCCWAVVGRLLGGRGGSGQDRGSLRSLRSLMSCRRFTLQQTCPAP